MPQKLSALKTPHQAHQNGTTVYEDQPFHHP